MAMEDNDILIVGPNTLQNQLMATFLEKEIPAKCVAAEDWSGAPPQDSNGGGKHVLLYDCMGKEPDSCVQDCDALLAGNHVATFVCLFNLAKGSGVEEGLLTQGVRGFFYLGDPFQQLVRGVKAVLDGECWVSRRIMSDLITKDNQWMKRAREDVLSRRETAILAMVVEGAANEEIGDKLCISKHTVKTHLYNIFKKINVSSRFQAALWAAKHL